ncbi:MAG: hypothetical protein AAF203_02010, partial [Pseudomonadota bacterium]
VSVRYYFGNWDIKGRIGHRTILTELPSQFQNLFQTDLNQVDDKNLWWSLQIGHSWENLGGQVSYTQYQYGINFGFFNRAVAPLLGYTLDTISFGSSFADFIVTGSLFYDWKQLFFSFDYSYLKNQFDSSQTQIFAPGLDWSFHPRWSVDVRFGLSFGETPEEELTQGNFLGVGISYSWK